MTRIFRLVFKFLVISISLITVELVVKAEGTKGKLEEAPFWKKRLDSIITFFDQLPLWSYFACLGLLMVIAYLILKRNNKRIPISTLVNVNRNVIPGNAQHIGSRAEQQDAFGFSDIYNHELIKKYGAVIVLADGMGGLLGGKEASQLAVQTFLNAYMSEDSSIPINEKLIRACHTANSAITNYAREIDSVGGVGTTLVAAVVYENHLFWVSVGDSHIYLIQNGLLKQLNTDHVYAKELDAKVMLGEIREEEALFHPERQSLTSFIGLEAIPELDYSLKAIPLFSGDQIILCSDGLYGSISEVEMLTLCKFDPQESAEQMVEAALLKQKPHQDNLTVAILSLT